MDSKFFSRQIGLIILALFGTIISGYLIYHHSEVSSGFQIGKSFCSLGEKFDCDQVAASPYSEIFGVPIAAIGLIFYVGLLSFYLIASKRSGITAEQFIAVSLFFSATSLIPTILLAYISAVKIGSICVICSLLYFINIILFWLSAKMPERTLTFWHSFTLGFKQVIIFLFSLSPKDTRLFRIKLFSWMLILLVTLVAVGAKSYLTANYFIPRAQHYIDQIIPNIIAGWENAEIKNIPIMIATIPTERDYFKGDPNAQISVVEFSDFECPYCARASEVISRAISKTSSNVNLVFKNFPLDASCNRLLNDSFHVIACRAAHAARCIGAQDESMFWEAHDILFMSTIDGKQIDMLASTLGLNEARYQTCLSSTEELTKIKQDIELGADLGIQGTPTIFIQGKQISLPLNNLELSERVLVRLFNKIAAD